MLPSCTPIQPARSLTAISSIITKAWSAIAGVPAHGLYSRRIAGAQWVGAAGRLAVLAAVQEMRQLWNMELHRANVFPDVSADSRA